jgi:hypothetical protein
VQPLTETPEELCTRLDLSANDWLYDSSTKLYLLPLGITEAVYRETKYVGFIHIYNCKVEEYHLRHRNLVRKMYGRRHNKERELLDVMYTALKQIEVFLESV